jgi:hypothetical protein
MFECFSIWQIEDEELFDKVWDWQEKKNKIFIIILDFLPEDYDKSQLINIIRKVVENDEDDYEKYLPKEYRKKMKKHLKEIKRGILF